NAVPAWSTLHIGEIAAGRHHVADVNDIEHSGRPQSDVVQPRAETVGECEIVHVALAVHPDRPKLCVVAISFGVFGQAETEITIKIVTLLYVGRETVEMIDPLDTRTPMLPVFLQHAFRAIHLGTEVERHAQRVSGPQGAALVRYIRKGGRQVSAAEPERGAIQILFARHPKTERGDLGLAGAAQDNRMVAPLLDAAE